jgi:hypothetical protein
MWLRWRIPLELELGSCTRLHNVRRQRHSGASNSVVPRHFQQPNGYVACSNSEASICVIYA